MRTRQLHALIQICHFYIPGFIILIGYYVSIILFLIFMG